VDVPVTEMELWQVATLGGSRSGIKNSNLTLQEKITLSPGPFFLPQSAPQTARLTFLAFSSILLLYEYYVSAEKEETESDPWFFEKNAYARRKSRGDTQKK